MYLCTAFEQNTGLWCNGNTADSGPAFPGSSPGSPAKKRDATCASLFLRHRETILLCSRIVSSLCALSRHCSESPLLSDRRGFQSDVPIGHNILLIRLMLELKQNAQLSYFRKMRQDLVLTKQKLHSHIVRLHKPTNFFHFLK